ncbi:Conserved_hypothetical protein [Hexamita inflata]|uniref:Uncharacterized protein n=1 Tax=Hexamita inflata TaxID=28002 RepID=A0AA86PKH0_9EUKA|nr:Conserved hypothetical protein [Hexamita inflata]
MLFISITLLVSSDSFTECFSSASYIKGDYVNNILYLHLLPFEELNLITVNNLCQNYLPGKNVIASLYFNDIYFPLDAEPLHIFKYVYNKEIILEFQLSQANYLHIVDKQNAMYQLMYDVDLIKVNNSVNSIQHTMYNGTNCFSSIYMSYTIYGDIQFNVAPNDCQVVFDANLEVYFEYNYEGVNHQITIPPCSSNCEASEYQTSSTTFNAISIYNMKKTVANTQQFVDFYEDFINNRILDMTLNLKTTLNSMYQNIEISIQDKRANDVWSCMPNDQANATYWGLYLYTLLNPDGLFIQIRDTLQNIFKCDTSATHHVVLDHYMMEGNVVNRQKQTIDMYTFSQAVGIQFESNAEYLDFRTNVFVNTSTMSLIVLSFCAEDGTILYEISQYGIAYLGCLAKEILHVYDSSFCVDLFVEDIHGCKSQLQHINERNHASIYYVQNTKFHFLGFFNFNNAMNYSTYEMQICFDCDQFDPTLDSEGMTCEKNIEILKSKFGTSAKIGFFYDNNFDIMQSHNVISEMNINLLPFIITTAVLCGVTFIGFICYFSSQRAAEA